MGKHLWEASTSIYVCLQKQISADLLGVGRKTHRQINPKLYINGQTVDKMASYRVGPTEPAYLEINRQRSAWANLSSAPGQVICAVFPPPVSPSIPGGTEFLSCTSVPWGVHDH